MSPVCDTTFSAAKNIRVLIMGMHIIQTGIYASIFLITVGNRVTSLWARLRLKSPISRLFAQPFIQAQIKRIIKAPRHLSLCGEFNGQRWIPRTKDQ